MKRKTFIVMTLGILIGILFLKIGIEKEREMEEVQRQVADSVIRFHVRANSNTKEDQEQKLWVRDYVIRKMKPLFENCDSKAEAEKVILNNKNQIKKMAEDALKAENKKQEVRISYQKEKFPLRVYGNYAFPPGVYDALRIDIGQARGKNWWCVMYPSLCFMDETEEIFVETSKDSLKQAVGFQVYDQLLIKKSEKKIKIKWKIYEIFQSYF